MRTFAAILIGAACVIGAWAAALPLLAAPPGPEETVQAFRDALHEGRPERALELLAPDVVIFEAGGAELSRDEYAAHHLPADIEFSRLVTSAVVWRRTGGDERSAWVLTRYATKGGTPDKPVASEDTETMTLRSTPDGWRIVHVHWSSHRAGRP